MAITQERDSPFELLTVYRIRSTTMAIEKVMARAMAKTMLGVIAMFKGKLKY